MTEREELELWMKEAETTYEEEILELLRQESPLKVEELAIRAYSNRGSNSVNIESVFDFALSGFRLEKAGKIRRFFLLTKEGEESVKFNDISEVPEKYNDYTMAQLVELA